MDGRLLLDTNAVIAVFARDPGVASRLLGREVFIPSIVLGELYFGAQKSASVATNVARTDTFSTEVSVFGCDTATARQYGQIKNALRARGHPIPDNDIWIAAIALQHDLILLSRDRHFGVIAGLVVETW